MNRAELVDEYGEVDRQMTLWKERVNPHAARHAELEAIIRSWTLEHAADKEPIFRGLLYQVKVSACGFKQVVSEAAGRMAFTAIEAAGKIDPFKVFRATLADLTAHMGKAWMAAHVGKEQTGPRKITVAAKEAAASVKEAATTEAAA